MRASTLLPLLLLLAGLASWMAQPPTRSAAPVAAGSAGCLLHDCGCAPEGCADFCCCSGAAPAPRAPQLPDQPRQRGGAVVVAGSCHGSVPAPFALHGHNPGLPAKLAETVLAEPVTAPQAAPDAGPELRPGAQQLRRRPPRLSSYSIS